ncbi:MAG: hypothetical protein U0176_24680 [Bacteroidia bacterium]
MKIQRIASLLLTGMLLCLLGSACKPQDGKDSKPKVDRIVEGELTDEQLRELIAEEGRLSDLSHGKSSTAIDVIEDAGELGRIRKEYPNLGTVSLERGLVAGDPVALAQLKERLRNSNPEVQRSGLEELDPFWDTVRISVDAEVRKLVYELSEKPATRGAAIAALRTADPQNAAAKLEGMLKGGNLSANDREEAISSLGQTNPRTSTVQLLGSMLQDSRKKGNPDKLSRSLVFALIDQYEHADLELRKSISGYLLPVANDPKEDRFWEDRILNAFAEHPCPDQLQFFMDRLKNKDYKEDCLMGIAILKGKNARATVEMSLDSPGEASLAMKAIPFAWKGDTKAAVKALLTAYKNISDEYNQRKLLDIAWQTGGAACAKDFMNAIPDAKSKAAFQEAYHLMYEPIGKDHPLQVQADKLAASGMLTRPVTMKEMEDIRQGNRGYGIWSWDEQFMDHVGNIAWFDAETGMFPNPYDDLLLNTFVPAAQGKLAGLECYMKWSDEDEDNPEEEVWVIFRGKGYHFAPEYYGDWYDLGAVESVLTKVLEDAGMEERFVSWNTGDQTAGYVFATPARAREVIKALDLDRGE